jgi:hypothetical protein
VHFKDQDELPERRLDKMRFKIVVRASVDNWIFFFLNIFQKNRLKTNKKVKPV